MFPSQRVTRLLPACVVYTNTAALLKSSLVHEKLRYVKLKNDEWLGAAPPRFSTGCAQCCGNVDYSTFANCEVFTFLTP